LAKHSSRERGIKGFGIQRFSERGEAGGTQSKTITHRWESSTLGEVWTPWEEKNAGRSGVTPAAIGSICLRPIQHPLAREIGGPKLDKRVKEGKRRREKDGRATDVGVQAKKRKGFLHAKEGKERCLLPLGGGQVWLK